MHDIFRHVVDRVLEVEPIAVSEHGPGITLLEADFVHVVAPSEIFRGSVLR